MAIIDAAGFVVLSFIVGYKYGLIPGLTVAILLTGVFALIRISDGA